MKREAYQRKLFIEYENLQKQTRKLKPLNEWTKSALSFQHFKGVASRASGNREPDTCQPQFQGEQMSENLVTLNYAEPHCSLSIFSVTPFLCYLSRF